jgi:hypothetical protein
MQGERSRSTTPLVLAALALLACLWIGWAGFDPDVPQSVVRETIRATPRQAIQLLVQYVVPAVLVVFLVREVAARRRS